MRLTKKAVLFLFNHAILGGKSLHGSGFTCARHGRGRSPQVRKYGDTTLSKYPDVYLLPIKADKIEDYKKMARDAGKIFIKHGALKYREYVASDLNAEWANPFTKIIKLLIASRSDWMTLAVGFNPRKEHDLISVASATTECSPVSRLNRR